MQEPTFDSKHLAKKVFLKFVKSQIFRLQKIFQEELYPSKNTSEKEKKIAMQSVPQKQVLLAKFCKGSMDSFRPKM